MTLTLSQVQRDPSLRCPTRGCTLDLGPWTLKNHQLLLKTGPRLNSQGWRYRLMSSDPNLVIELKPL